MTKTAATTKKKPAARKKPNRGANKGNGFGRPTKMTQTTVNKARAYYERIRDSKGEVPYVEELAIYELDVDRSTISDWVRKADDEAWQKDKKPELIRLHAHFSLIIKKLATLQLLRLKKEGMTEKRHAVAIFLMKADHGMVETSRTELTGRNGQPIAFKPIQVMNIKGRMPEDGKDA